jgi:hypothetical protein
VLIICSEISAGSPTFQSNNPQIQGKKNHKSAPLAIKIHKPIFKNSKLISKISNFHLLNVLKVLQDL